MELRLVIDGREEPVVCLERNGSILVRSRSRVAEVRVRRVGAGWEVEVDGRSLRVHPLSLPPLSPGAELRFLCARRERVVRLPDRPRRVESFHEPAREGPVLAGHLGRVSEICVQPGTLVRRGQPLCRIRTVELLADVPAPADGRVTEVLVALGDPVRPETPVCRLEGGEGRA